MLKKFEENTKKKCQNFPPVAVMLKIMKEEELELLLTFRLELL